MSTKIETAVFYGFKIKDSQKLIELLKLDPDNYSAEDAVDYLLKKECLNRKIQAITACNPNGRERKVTFFLGRKDTYKYISLSNSNDEAYSFFNYEEIMNMLRHPDNYIFENLYREYPQVFDKLSVINTGYYSY